LDIEKIVERSKEQSRRRIEGYHFFSPTIAEEYGVECAVILAGLIWWIEGNRGSKGHQHEGRTWARLSRRVATEVWYYLTEDVIRLRIERLVEAGVLLKAQLGGTINKEWADRSMWYALVDEDRFLAKAKGKD
jgi:hypothetical protein